AAIRVRRSWWQRITYTSGGQQPRACRQDLTPGLSAKHRAPGIDGRGSELLLDPDQLIVFGQPVGSRQRSGLDLAAIGCDREIGDRFKLGFSRAVRKYSAPARPRGGLDRLEGLGQGADVVDLDEQRIGDAALDPIAQPARIGDENI